MTAYNVSLGPPVIWRLLFAFVFLGYLATYICFIFFANILVYNLLFFIVFWLSLHLDEFMKVFPFFDAGQCAAMTCRNRKVQLQTYTKISSKLQFFHERQNCSSWICFWHIVEFFCKLIFSYILLTHGDIEVNPGPKKNCSTNFSFCHWNLNSLSAHNYVKLSSLQAYNSVYKHDVICLSETYLDNSVLSDESDLNFPGYKLVRADYPGNVKRGGVCIYFKESLSTRF